MSAGCRITSPVSCRASFTCTCASRARRRSKRCRRSGNSRAVRKSMSKAWSSPAPWSRSWASLASAPSTATLEGSGLVAYSERFPDRYFVVGIAEQHAVTLAAGLACEGAKPVGAIYSTFLQRAYDQLIHDVAIQNLPVLFAVDRAGVVGPDGPT